MLFITDFCSAAHEEECRSLGKTRVWCTWDDELAVVTGGKPPGAVQETLGVLENTRAVGMTSLLQESKVRYV